jgi:hypothetical protein
LDTKPPDRRLRTAIAPIVHGRHWPRGLDVRNFPRVVAPCRKRGGASILENMGWDGEVLIEPTMATNSPVRIQLHCTSDVGGRTQCLTLSRTIDAEASAAATNERDGGLNVTVNVLNVETRQDAWPGSDRKDGGSASGHYWMDSLPCLSNRRESGSIGSEREKPHAPARSAPHEPNPFVEQLQPTGEGRAPVDTFSADDYPHPSNLLTRESNARGIHEGDHAQTSTDCRCWQCQR